MKGKERERETEGERKEIKGKKRKEGGNISYAR